MIIMWSIAVRKGGHGMVWHPANGGTPSTLGLTWESLFCDSQSCSLLDLHLGKKVTSGKKSL